MDKSYTSVIDTPVLSVPWLLLPARAAMFPIADLGLSSKSARLIPMPIDLATPLEIETSSNRPPPRQRGVLLGTELIRWFIEVFGKPSGRTDVGRSGRRRVVAPKYVGMRSVIIDRLARYK